MVSYATSDNDPYLYPDTDVLRNKAGITSNKELRVYEDAVADVAILDILRFIEKRDINLALWQEIHRSMFKEVYSWAGKIRTVNISKGTSTFAYPLHIERSANDIFKKLAAERYLEGLDFDRLVQRLSVYYNDLNALHPFREGNGRSLKILMNELLSRLGYDVDWSKLSMQDNIKASISGFNGDCKPFEDIFRNILVKQ